MLEEAIYEFSHDVRKYEFLHDVTEEEKVQFP